MGRLSEERGLDRMIDRLVSGLVLGSLVGVPLPLVHLDGILGFRG